MYVNTCVLFNMLSFKKRALKFPKFLNFQIWNFKFWKGPTQNHPNFSTKSGKVYYAFPDLVEKFG